MCHWPTLEYCMGKSFAMTGVCLTFLCVCVCVCCFYFDEVQLFLSSSVVHNNTDLHSGKHEGDNTFCTAVPRISRYDVQKALLFLIHHVRGLNLGSDIGCHEWRINVIFHYPSSWILRWCHWFVRCGHHIDFEMPSILLYSSLAILPFNAVYSEPLKTSLGNHK